MRFFIVTLMVVMASLPTQAQQACTQMGCESGLTIQVPDVRFRSPGKYVYLLTLDDKRQVKCTGSLPMKTCDKPAITCNAKEVMIEEEGCALTPDAQRFGDVVIHAKPKKIFMKVLQNNEIVAYQTWKPSYSKVLPNGEKCGPVCYQAGVDLKTH